MKASTVFRRLIKAEKDNDKIAGKLWKLLNKRKHEFENGIGYLDIAIADGSKISYVTEDRRERFIFKSLKWRRLSGTWKYTETNTFKPFIFSLRSKYAYMSSPGKLARKLNLSTNDVEIEQFNRVFNKNLGLKVKEYYFKEVSGDDIAMYYSALTYRDSKGSLGSSCMKNVESGFFDIYCDNENCNLLVLFDKCDWVIGRALVWKNVREVGKDIKLTLMDRVYTSNSNDEELFFQYAKEKGYYRKYSQSYGNVGFLSPEGNIENLILETSISNLSEDSYAPYLDTFRFLNTDLNKLCTNGSIYSNYIELSSTSGDSIQSYFSVKTVFSEYYDEDIPEDEAVFSNYLNSFIYERRSVTMYYYGTYNETESSLIADDYDDVVYLNKYNQYWHDNSICKCENCNNDFPKFDLNDDWLCPSCEQALKEDEVPEENKEEVIEEPIKIVNSSFEYRPLTMRDFERVIAGCYPEITIEQIDEQPF